MHTGLITLARVGLGKPNGGNRRPFSTHCRLLMTDEHHTGESGRAVLIDITARANSAQSSRW